MVSQEDVAAWVIALAAVYVENKECLTDLDSAIGDADHGINMERGFQAAAGELDSKADMDIGSMLKTVGMTLVSTVGGASGPLYGTLFIKGAAACKDKTELDLEDLLAMFQRGVEGVMQRGKAQAGEKTMVDALIPAVTALQQSQAAGENLGTAMNRAVAAAETGMKETIPMLATKGRASYLGQRSVGHQDPGATSSYLLLKAAAQVWS